MLNLNKYKYAKNKEEKSMQTIQVHDKAVVLVLTKQEAKTLKSRLECLNCPKQYPEIKKTKVFEKVETKLAVAMGEI
jgi:3-deoxy-D-manno-octulosonate 8-phosphate phosphatase KdsC-like HAD superfamily phosphatase